MAKKKKQSAKGGPDKSWMLTFSDMMTLLLTFFVLLFSMASTDSEKLNQALEAIQNELTALDLGILGGQGFMTGGRENPSLKTRPDEVRTAMDDIKRLVSTENLEDDVEVTRTERGLKVSVATDLLFDPASAVVKTELHPLLRKISVLATRLAKTVRVEGNTDRTPFAASKYDSNLELSAYRAMNVLQVILEERAFTPHGACVGAFGEYNPVYSEERTDEERRANRRVDVFIADPPDAESFWYALMQSYLDNANEVR